MSEPREENAGRGGRDEARRLRRLMDRHGPALVLYARQWCDTPEDVVQEALAKLATRRREPANEPAWLYRVVRNGAISASRSARRRRRHEAAAARERRAWFTSVNGRHPDVEAATAALESLPVEQREVVVAHLWGGLTFEQVGRVVECSSSQAHRRYAAGLKALRERLGLT